MYLCPNLISWWSKKQIVVARSSAEAEYCGLAQITTTEVLWVQTLLVELKVPFTTPSIFCDNQSTVVMAHNPVLHARTKCMEVDLFFVREKVLNKTLVVCHISGLDQKVDILTKSFSSSRFLELKSKLNPSASSLTL